MLVYNLYINKITKKFNLINRSFFLTLLLLEELIKFNKKVTKYKIKAY
jgi:hypothetical protein